MPALRPLVAAACSCLLAGCLTACTDDAAVDTAASPRNVLLVSLDALRADHLGSYGYERETSPFLDELAARGRRFDAAFVNTHGTPPSHTTLFTSLYQETHRVSIPKSSSDGHDLHVAPDALELLPEILTDQGYLTLAVTGGGFMERTFNLDQGFERYHDDNEGIADARRNLLRMLRRYRDDPRPRFVFLHTYEIHSPYRPPRRYQDLFGSYESDLDPENRDLTAIQNDALAHLDAEDLRHLVAMYDREIRYTDDVLRELFTDLREIGFLDDALVVVTSDHGEEFGDHGGLLHRVSLYDELLHVPLLIHGGGAEPGVDDRLVSTIDVAPTILAGVGLKVPSWMEGRNLLGADPAPREEVFSQYAELLYSIRTPRWKLIAWPGDRKVELYDPQTDPGELQDLAAARPRDARRLLARLRDWRKARPRLEDAAATPVTVPEETRRRLEALGYGG